MNATTEPMAGTQSIRRAVALLEAFTDGRPVWNVSELADRLNLNRTTTYRLLTALEGAEYVERDPSTEHYRLGSGLIALGARAQRANSIRAVALPELERLAAETGETATLEILSGSEMVIIEEIPGEFVTSGSQHIGSRWPLYATSTGKAILAALPAAERSVALAEPPVALTAKTITSARRMSECLREIARVGYAVAAEELELGYVAVGAAVRDAAGRPVAAVSLGGTLTRMTAERIPQIGALVQAAAGRLSHRLGYRKREETADYAD